MVKQNQPDYHKRHKNLKYCYKLLIILLFPQLKRHNALANITGALLAERG